MNERPTGRRPTNAGRSTGRAQRPATLRAPAPDAQKNRMLIIWGCVGGGVVLILMLAMLAGGGGENGGSKRSKIKGKGPKSDALRRCEEGAKTCKAGLAKLADATGDQKERLRGDIEQGIKTIDEGLAAYTKAAGSESESADAASFRGSREGFLREWSQDLLGEAIGSATEGQRIVSELKTLMYTPTQSLSAEEKSTLREGLTKAKKLMDHGNSLNSRVEALGGTPFDSVVYNETLKEVRRVLNGL